MSLGRHPDISGNLTLTVPGIGSGGRTFHDVHEYADYAGRYSPYGEPPLIGGDGTDEGDLWSVVTLTSPGMPVDIALYYNSHSRANGAFGYRRTCSLNLYARGAGTPISGGDFDGFLSIVILTRGDDSTATYIFNPFTGIFDCENPAVLNKLELVLTGDYAPVWIEKTPDGRQMGYPATSDGSISPIVVAQDSVGNQHLFSYNDDGLLIRLRDSVGRFVTFSYNDDKLLKSIEDWAGRTTNFSYDTETDCSRPRLVSVSDAADNLTYYAYDDFGRDFSSIKTSGVVEDSQGWSGTASGRPAQCI